MIYTIYVIYNYILRCYTIFQEVGKPRNVTRGIFILFNKIPLK